MQSLSPLPTPTSQPSIKLVPSTPPRLWLQLSPQLQQQLACRLADLLRRIHSDAPMTQEVRHDEPGAC